MASVFTELAKKSGMIFFGKIVNTVVSFFAVIVIARLLGANIYGQFTYILSFLTIFTIVSSLGLSNGLVSFLSRNTFSPESKKSFLTYSLLVTTILGLCIILFGYVFKDVVLTMLLNNQIEEPIYLLMLPTFLFVLLNSLMFGALQAVRKIKEIVLITDIVMPATNLLLLVILVLFVGMESCYSLIIPYYIVQLFSILYYVWQLKKVNLIGRIDWYNNNHRILLFSLPLLFVGFVSVITQNVDKYMIGYLAGATDVGIYRVAFQFGTLASIALVSVNVIFAPLISNLFFDKRYKDLLSMYKITTKWVTIVNVLIFGMVLVFPRDILAITGPEFVSGATALIVITVGQVINSLVGSVGYMNTMTGHPRYVLISGTVAMIANVILNYFLIPLYGITGAAIATAIAMGCNNILNFIFMYSKLHMQPYDKTYLRLLGVLVLSIGFIYVISRFVNIYYLWRLLICGILYVAFFGFLVYKFVVTDFEIHAIKNLYYESLKKRK